jgi:uncharacterized membrane protein SpoIIM required for sporulation
MKVAELLESRKANWRELEAACTRMEKRQKQRSPRDVARFASLYRAACADLALADSYHLPPATIRFLHELVGRAHNQLYRSQTFNFADWGREMFVRVPARLFRDNCLRLAYALFWGVFLASMYLASSASPLPKFAAALVGQEMLDLMEQMHAHSVGDDREGESGGATGLESGMAGFYIQHNTGIGLRCFAGGLLFGIGGLFTTVFNAALLGAVFGYMTRVSSSDNFFQFVTAHGPFELTAIILSAAAGMRLGFALVDTSGLTRLDSLRRAARRAMPTMGAAMVLFFFAALIEGFISPSSLPYSFKVAVATISSAMMMFYFVVLGSRPLPPEDLEPEVL